MSDMVNALSMTFDGEIETSQTISRDGISTALKYDCLWLEGANALINHLFHDCHSHEIQSYPFEQCDVLFVINAISQRNIHRVVLTLL